MEAFNKIISLLRKQIFSILDIGSIGKFQISRADGYDLENLTIDVSAISKKVSGDGEDDLPQTNPVLAGVHPTVMGILNKVKTRRVDIGGIAEYMNISDGCSIGDIVSSDLFDSIVLDYIRDDFPKYGTLTKSLPSFYSRAKIVNLGFSKVTRKMNLLSGDIVEEVILGCKIIDYRTPVGIYPPSCLDNMPSLKIVRAPNLEEWYLNGNDAGFVKNNSSLEEIIAPRLRITWSTYKNSGFVAYAHIKLRKFIVGAPETTEWIFATGSGTPTLPNLIHLEFIGNVNVNLNTIRVWSPTNALDSTLTDLIEDSNRCTNNREQFLVNFIEYILHKLQDRTGKSKLTLTLSATVYDAIFSDESGFEYEGQPIGEYVTSYIAGINWSVAK